MLLLLGFAALIPTYELRTVRVLPSYLPIGHAYASPTLSMPVHYG